MLASELTLSAMLGILPGVTAIIGGGGKTTLMYTLAEELKAFGAVIVCTTTGILPPIYIPTVSGADEAELRSLLSRLSVVCVGLDAGDGKLKHPACSFERLSEIARYVLVEADGSRGLPMKAHTTNEPVIPEANSQTILVIGASGFGRTIRDAAHRPALYAELAGVDEDELITPELAARVALAENLHNRVFVSQADSELALAAAKELKLLLDCPVCAGSLHKKEYFAI
jgi:probable selenium-dependent hydroxylase accessory protein YqeC